MTQMIRGVFIACSLLVASSQVHAQPAPTEARPSTYGSVPLDVTYRSRLGSSYRLVRATFSLDGTLLYDGRVRSGDRLFVGRLTPGEHILVADVELRGDGESFSYLQGYGFRVRDRVRFAAFEGQPMRIEVVSNARGGPTAAYETRPDVDFIVLFPRDVRPPQAPAPPPPAANPYPPSYESPYRGPYTPPF